MEAGETVRVSLDTELEALEVSVGEDDNEEVELPLGAEQAPVARTTKQTSWRESVNIVAVPDQGSGNSDVV